MIIMIMMRILLIATLEIIIKFLTHRSQPYAVVRAVAHVESG